MSASTLDLLKKELVPGQVYRRSQLVKFTTSVDRHLKQLVGMGVLQKVDPGVYYRPEKSIFGDLPPDENKLVEAFLKDKNFLLVSLNAYNSMGVGTTQLYNEKLVYNHKRDGHISLNGRKYYFIKNRKFPKKMSDEFLLVDLVNNLKFLAEDTGELKRRVKKKSLSMSAKKMATAVERYGKARTQKFFSEFLGNLNFKHGY